jgi:hypothetical protein
MLRRLLIFLVIIAILGVIGLLAILGYSLYSNYYHPSTSSTLPPPLANVDFPSEQIQYPSDWPNELTFPKDLELVDSSSGTMPDNSIKGWSAKLRYQGKPLDAEKMILAFFESHGWTIVDKKQLDSGGFSLLIQRKSGNGIIVIDTDPIHTSQTIIIVSVFP